MVEQEAVLELLSEDEGLAIVQILAGVAALLGGGGAISNDLEVRGDTWAVVGDVNGVVSDIAAREARAEEVAVVQAIWVAAGAPEGWARGDLGRSGLGGLGVGLRGGRGSLDG